MSSTASMIAMIKQKTLDMALDHKAIMIAQELGTARGKKHGNLWVWDDKKLAITWDDYGNNLSVLYEGEPKLTTQTGEIIQAILQNEWIGHLYRVWNEADKRITFREIDEKRKQNEKKEDTFKDETGSEFNEQLNTTQTTPSVEVQITEKERKWVEEYVKEAPWTKETTNKTVVSLQANKEEDNLHNQLIDQGWKTTDAGVYWTQYKKDRLTLTIMEEIK